MRCAHSSHWRVEMKALEMRTFDCRVVFVDEMALDELDCETTLSHSTTTYYHQLIFPEELRHWLVLATSNECRCATTGDAPTLEAIVSQVRRSCGRAVARKSQSRSGVHGVARDGTDGRVTVVAIESRCRWRCSSASPDRDRQSRRWWIPWGRGRWPGLVERRQR